MAVVYLAEDLRHERKIALKVLRPELTATLGAERFLREIQIAARLTHPNILPLFDSGRIAESSGPGMETTEGPSEPFTTPRTPALLYYTMPYLPGDSLRDRLDREKQLPIGEALQITREVADALGYAHEQGIIHRDIKPENILFGAGHAVVTDFGIARAVTAAGAKSLTETGLSVGTRVYMSPEQASAEPELDERSDIYSLGCVLYEMLAGEPPYTGPTAQAILAKKWSEATPRVSVVRERVPHGVELAIERALAKTPADRFRTAAEFASALSEPKHPRVEPSPASPADRPPSIAVLPLANLSADPEQAYFCEGIAEEIINALVHLQGLRVVARSSSLALKKQMTDAREVGRKLEVDTVLEGSVRRRTSSLEAYEAYLRGLFEWNSMTVEGFARCQELFREAIRLDADFAPAYAKLAESFTSAVWWADQPPPEGLAQVTPLLEQALTLDPDLAHAHSVAGIVRGFFERDRGAGERELRRAVELAPNDAMAHIYLALFLAFVKGDAGETVAHVHVALRLDPMSPAMRTWAGAILFYCGGPEEGLHILEEQVAATPYLWMPRYFFGLALAASGRLSEARAAAEKASELSADNSITLSLVACMCALDGDGVSSDAALERLRRRTETRYVPPIFLAWAHAARGESDAALRRVQEALTGKDPWVSTHRLCSPGFLTAEPRLDALIASAFG